ncbi:MAG: DUF2007 domain-containing protein [Gammaproteobacteria bacterium]
MRRVFASHDPLLAAYCRTVLSAHGIDCIAPFEILGGAAGQIPFTECLPEIWVANDADAYRAQRILEDALAGDPLNERQWQCADCGEWLEPQFSQCWRCSATQSA